MSRIRVTTSADVTSLPAIERSAGEAFRQFPGLAWIADDDVMSVEEHQRLVALNTCWVATRAVEAAETGASDTGTSDTGASDTGTGHAAVDAPIGFLCTEAFSLENHKRGASVAGDALHIWELAVALDAQGAGVGSLLMQRAIAYAVNDPSFSRLTLTTFRDVAFNAPFYERLGFRVLQADELDVRLDQTLAAEEAHGLPRESRCAMQLDIDR